MWGLTCRHPASLPFLFCLTTPQVTRLRMSAIGDEYFPSFADVNREAIAISIVFSRKGYEYSFHHGSTPVKLAQWRLLEFQDLNTQATPQFQFAPYRIHTYQIGSTQPFHVHDEVSIEGRGTFTIQPVRFELDRNKTGSPNLETKKKAFPGHRGSGKLGSLLCGERL